MTSKAIPTRKQEKIDTSICPRCYSAIPTDRLAAHIEWHAAKESK